MIWQLLVCSGSIATNEKIRELRGQVEELEYTIKLLSNG